VKFTGQLRLNKIIVTHYNVRSGDNNHREYSLPEADPTLVFPRGPDFYCITLI